MTVTDLISQRLKNQALTGSSFKKATEVVEYMCAIQAQEYAMAKWAIGLRSPGSREQDVDKAFNEGKILRTHVLRPTWHFISPKDIRWMLELTAPRIHIANNFMCRKLGLDKKLLKKSAGIFVKALEGGKHLSRSALQELLQKNKIGSQGHHLSYITMYAELEGLICSCPREGKQFTYALLDERAGKQKKLDHDEALAELSRRYFISRGPATIKDYCTWSGLSVKDAKEGIASLEKNILKESFQDAEYYSMSSSKNTKALRSFLMPDYDEYGMGYKDRSAIFNAAKYKAAVSRGNPVFNRMIILNGRIEGTWQRTFQKKEIAVETFPFSKLNSSKQKLLKEAVKDFQRFTTDS